MPTIPADDPRLIWSGAVSCERGDGWVKPWRIPYQDQDLYSPGVSGLAGRAVIASYDGHYEESQEVIAERLLPLREYLSLDMERLIRNTITRNRERSELEIRQGFEDFFRHAETDDDSSAN